MNFAHVQLDGGVYAIVNQATGRRYVGSTRHLRVRLRQHWSLLVSGIHTCRHLQGSWNKHGESQFAFEVLESADLAHQYDVEQKWIDHYASALFNVTTLARSSRYPRTTETKRKMSDALRRRVLSPEAKMRVSMAVAAANSVRIVPKEWRENHSRLMTGRKHTEASKRKQSEALIGKKRSMETRAKMSASRKGKPLTPAQYAALIKARAARKPLTAESLAKMSRSRSAYWAKRRQEHAA